MPTRNLIFEISIVGGWATDFGPNFSGQIADQAKQEREIRLPFLVDAENNIYELDGGVRKLWGATKLNSTAITESSTAQTVMGLFDYWRQGTGGSETQKRIAHAGTKILKEDLDGTWDDLKTGLESGKIPDYTVADDILIMATDSNTDVPQSWDQTTLQDLAGSPPNFSFSEFHKNRAWAAGVASNPSRLFFSALLDPEDWNGSGSGSIDIDPSDGDMITGLASHKDELIVFKGPNKGSIHRITGSSPTGSDAFARKNFIDGIGAINNRCIFRFGDDLGFMGVQGSIHSLSATASFGDYNQSFLSAPIDKYIRRELNSSRLKFSQAVNFDQAGIVIITLSSSGNSENDRCLVMDYRFQDIRWSLWTIPSAASISMIKSSDGMARPYFGGYDGFVLEGDQVDRSWDGTSIPWKVTTPFMNFGSSDLLKTAENFRVGIAPKGDYTMSFQWQRDNQTAQTQTVSQSGGDVLGPASSNQFTLGTSTLSGGRFLSHLFPASGEFRDLQIQLTQNGLFEDAEIHSIGAHVSVSGISTEAP